eukprot:3781841-Alexandrium_andersonii.AAC.1
MAAARASTPPSIPGSEAALASGREAPSAELRTPMRVDTPRDVSDYMSPTRTLEFSASLGSPE